jgi:hypothetical protein
MTRKASVQNPWSASHGTPFPAIRIAATIAFAAFSVIASPGVAG